MADTEVPGDGQSAETGAKTGQQHIASENQAKSSDPWGGGPPTPLGEHEAYGTVGTVAAPLLAGFAVTAAIGIARDPVPVGMPGPALIAFVVATGLLLLALQSTLYLRRYHWTPEDFEKWFPQDTRTVADVSHFVARNKEDRRSWKLWRRVVGATYQVGLVAFLMGLGFLILPPGDCDPIVAARTAAAWMSFGFAGLAAVWWIVGPLGIHLEARLGKRHKGNGTLQQASAQPGATERGDGHSNETD